MAKPNPIGELAQRCVQRLVANRAAGECYPMPLDQLLDAAAGPSTEPGSGPAIAYSAAERARAVKHSVFRQRCLVAHPRHPDAPVVLAEDLAVLAASPPLFQFACRHTAGGPPWLAADLKKAVAKPIQAAFEQALRSLPPAATPVPQSAMPPTCEAAGLPEAVVAFSADERLCLQILGVLGQPSLPAYPTLRQLAERAGLSPTKLAPRLKKLASSARFLAQAVPLFDKHLDSPVAIRSAAEAMARRSESIELLVRLTRTDKKRLIARKDLLKKAATAVRPLVQAYLDEQLAAGGPLGGVAAVRDGKELKFFLFEDLEPTAVRWRVTAGGAMIAGGAMTAGESGPAVTGATAGPAASDAMGDLANFAAQLAAAFKRLDAESGGHNQVGLRQLRAALPTWGRAAFDARLLSLRQAGEYTLSGMQNRGGVSVEDQEAGIREGGVLRIYLSRLGDRDISLSGNRS